MADEQRYKAQWISEVFKIPDKSANQTSSSGEAANKTVVSNVGTTFNQPEGSFNMPRINRVADTTIDSRKLMADWEAMNVSEGITKKALFMDIETLGEQGTDFFNPTEIAMRTYQVNSGFNFTDVIGTNRGSLMSLAVAPDANTQKKIDKLIKALKTPASTHGTFLIDGTERVFNEAEYRSLFSLMRYSDAGIFSQGAVNILEGKVARTVNYGYINPGASGVKNLVMPEYGVSLRSKGNLDRIVAGYENLKKYGTTGLDTITVMNNYVEKRLGRLAFATGEAMAVTANGRTFDMPGLSKWFGTMVNDARGSKSFYNSTFKPFMKDIWAPMIKNNLDTYRTMASFVSDPMEQLPGLGSTARWKVLQFMRGRKAEGGLLRLENMVPMVTGNFTQFHWAHNDIDATAQVLQKLYNPLNRIINEVKASNSGLSVPPNVGNVKYAGFDAKAGAVLNGDTFFSMKGIASTDSRFAGEILKYNQAAGKFENAYQFSSGNPAPLYKNTYYQALGFQTVKRKDKLNQALVLYNMDEEQYHVIYGKTRKDLMDVMNSNLDYMAPGAPLGTPNASAALANPVLTPEQARQFGGQAIISDPVNEARLNARNYDRAMRRYRKMYSREGGGGFDLWAQNHTALDYLNEFKKTRAEAGKAIGDSHQELLSALLSDSGATKKLQEIFGTSFYNNKAGVYNFTTEKVRDLVYMQDALLNEHSLFQPFMSTLKASSLSKEGASIALMRMNNMMSSGDKIGQATRNSWDPVRERFMPVFNPNGNDIKYYGIDTPWWGDTKMSYVDISSRKSTISDIRKVISSGKLAESTNMGPAKRLALDMVGDLTGRGIFSDKQSRYIKNQINAMSDNKTTVNSLANHIGNTLWENIEKIQYGQMETPEEAMMGLWNQIPKGYTPLLLGEEQKTNVMKKAIEEAGILSSHQKIHPELQTFFDIHNKAIEDKKTKALRLLGQNTKITSGMWQTFQVEEMRSAERSLLTIEESFRKQGFSMMVATPEETGSSLKLLFFDSAQNEAMKKLDATQIMNSGKAMVVNMPIIDKNGSIFVTDRMTKVNQYLFEMGSNGKLQVKSGFDYIVDEIAGSAKYARKVIESKGNVFAGQTVVSKSIMDAVDSLSGVGEKWISSWDAANMMKTPRMNINAIAKSDMVIFRTNTMLKSYLDEKARGLRKLGKAEEAREVEMRSTDRDLKLSDLHPDEAADFDRYVMGLPLIETAKGKMLTVQDVMRYTSTKEGEGLAAMASLDDTRRFLPFGRYYSGTSQKLRQALNIWGINKSAATTKEAQDLLGGILGRSKLVTKDLLDATEGQITGLLLNTATASANAMDTLIAQTLTRTDISDKVRRELSGWMTPTTYDGQFIMRSDVASLYANEETLVKDVSGIDFAFVGPDKMAAGRGRKQLLGGERLSQKLTFKAGDDGSMSYGNEEIRRKLAKLENVRPEDIHLLQDETMLGKMGVDKKGRAYQQIEAKYINTASKDTIFYSHEYEAKNISYTAGKLSITQTVEAGNYGVKYTNQAGSKATGNAWSRETLEALFGKDRNVEAVIIGGSYKYRSPGEKLYSEFSYGLNEINKISDPVQKAKAIDEFRKLSARVEGVGADAVYMNADGNMVLNSAISSQVTIGDTVRMSIVQELGKIVGGDFENRLTMKAGKYDIAFGMDEIRRADVGETLGVIGSVGRNKYTPKDLRRGIFKIGPRELTALNTSIAPDGSRLTETTQFLSSYTGLLSAYQNPELGDPTAGYTRYYDMQKKRYIENPKMINGALAPNIVKTPNTVQNMTNIFTNDKKGVVIGLDSTDFINMGQDATTVGDVTKEVYLRRGMFNDFVTRRDVGSALTYADFDGTILDIGNYMEKYSAASISKGAGQLDDLTKATMGKVDKASQAISKRIQEQGGFYLQLAKEVEVPVDLGYGKKTTKLVDKQWVTLEGLVPYGKLESGEKAVTAGKLNHWIVTIDDLNRQLMNANHGVFRDGVQDQKKEILTLERRLQEAVVNYRGTALESISGTEGDVIKSLSARVEHSGQFRVQIMSPANMKKNGINEGTVIINEKDYADMTRGMSQKDIDFMKSQSDIYAVAGRYPTTYSNSLGTPKVKVAGKDVVTSGEAILTPGMLQLMLGDADGDFMSMTLAHYNSNIYGEIGKNLGMRDAVLKEMSSYTKSSSNLYSHVGNMLYEDLDKTLTTFGVDMETMRFTGKELSSSLKLMAGGGTTEDFDIFMGKLNDTLSGFKKGGIGNDMNDAQKNALWKIANGQTDAAAGIREYTDHLILQTQNTGIAEAEAMAARELRRNIGTFSNISYKLRELGEQALGADTKLFTVGDMQRIDAVGQLLEQSSISSKHLQLGDVENVADARRMLEERMQKATELKDALLSGDREGFRKLNAELGGVFKDTIDKKATETIMQGTNSANLVVDHMRQKGTIDEVFDTMAKLGDIFQAKGGDLSNLLYNDHLQFGLSSGVRSAEQLQNILSDPSLIMTRGSEQYLKMMGKDDLIEMNKAKFTSRVKYLEDNGIQSSAYSYTQTVGSEATESIMKAASELPISKNAMVGAAIFGGAWALSGAFRESPYERAKHDRTQSEDLQGDVYSEGHQRGEYVPDPKMTGPTARITPGTNGYQNLQINLKASNMNNMTNDQIIAMVSKELQNQMPIQMSVNANSSDNSTKVDKQWVNNVVSRATRFGMGF